MPLQYKPTLVTTTPYTVAANDEVVFVNVAGLASIILPVGGEAGGGSHRAIYIKDGSGQARTNPITITSTGGKTIDGEAFAILNVGYSHILVVWDGQGTNWQTIA